MSTVRLEPGNRAVLEGRLDLSTLMEFRRKVDETLPPTNDLTVDFSLVEVTDSAALALLVNLFRRAQHAGGRVTVEGVTERLAAMISLAGIDALLDSPPGPESEQPARLEQA